MMFREREFQSVASPPTEYLYVFAAYPMDTMAQGGSS